MAAIDYFLKIDGVEGESQDAKHKGEIEIDSWSWGETQSGASGSGGGGGAGKVAMQDFHFVTKVSKASPKLLLACASGQHLSKALLTCRKAGKDQQDFLGVTLTDVLVSSFTTGGAEASSIVPTDQFSLNFSKIEYQYAQRNPDGSLAPPIKVGWDVRANKSVSQGR
jgi:type VI secretion system secreted protein Hcp